jgi:hypothetical protein
MKNQRYKFHGERSDQSNLVIFAGTRPLMKFQSLFIPLLFSLQFIPTLESGGQNYVQINSGETQESIVKKAAHVC